MKHPIGNLNENEGHQSTCGVSSRRRNCDSLSSTLAGVEVTGWRFIDQSNIILERKTSGGKEIPEVLRTDRILEVGPYRLLMAFSNEPIPCEVCHTSSHTTRVCPILAEKKKGEQCYSTFVEKKGINHA